MNSTQKRVSLIVFTVIFALLSITVSGYEYLGAGQWAGSNVNYAIVTSDSSYVAPIMNAAAMWTNYTNFSLTRNNSSRINVYVRNESDTDWDGITIVNGQTNPPFVDPYSYVHITINTYYTNTYSSDRINAVVCHEFGHSASLGHVLEYALMYKNNVWNAVTANPSLLTAPAPIDIASINNRY